MRPFFDAMRKNYRNLTYGALIAALYVALTYLQNALIPGSATWAIQFRASEALCVLALYTPSAIWGLGVGCLLFNLSYAGALPLDAVVGTLASLLAGWGMYLLRNVRVNWGMYILRNVRVKKVPLPALLIPGITNGLLVGWELWLFIGGDLWLNMLYVAIGEWLVLLTLGAALAWAMERRNLPQRIFI